MSSYPAWVPYLKRKMKKEEEKNEWESESEMRGRSGG
jgi:hypothetical protein